MREGWLRGGERGGAGSRVSCALWALETLARCGLRGWCGRTARAAGAGTRLPRQERARAAVLLTGRGVHGAAGCAVACCKPRFLRRKGARNACAVRVAGLVRAHGARGGRGDAPAVAGAGARGGASDGAGTHGAALCAAACRKPRFLRMKALATLAPSALRSPQRRPMPQRAVKGQGPFDISERRPSPYRAQRGRPLTAAERANQHRAYQHERSTKTPCSN